MSTLALVAVAVGALAVGLLAGYVLPPHGPGPRSFARAGRSRSRAKRSRGAASRPRSASPAENAVLMPAFLAKVPLEVPLPAQSETGMPLLEAIEQRAIKRRVAVEHRVSRGRTHRDALRRLLVQEDFDRIIVSADQGLAARARQARQ